MAAKGAGEESTPRTMREITQRKLIDEVIGCTEEWKVLVMDTQATRVISSALTMYDIMERRVTLVEQLKMNRQPFPDMDVVYLVSPSNAAVQRILDDFENSTKAKYGRVHLFFLDAVSDKIFDKIQKNPYLVARVKTFKEIHLDFLATEASVFQFDLPDTLSLMHGVMPEPAYPALLGRKLANLCITLNEHPCIRYMATPAGEAKEIATVLHATLVAYKKANPSFWCNGDDAHHERERGQVLILDRTFDPLSPLMHEYTYQAMTNDLLDVEEGVLAYTAATNKGGNTEKKALLGENDELWVELRHSHIAKVIEIIKDRMSDIIQNNSGAALAKKSGKELDITTMAAAVKKLPEYTQTMNKLGQHVAIAQQCMDAFGKLGLMNLSQVEQTISTGFDEDGKEVKGAKLLQLVSDTLRSPMNKDERIRLLAIFSVATRPSAEDLQQLMQTARLSNDDRQTIANLERIMPPPEVVAQVAEKGAKGGFFSSIFKGKAEKHAPTPEGEYADTRHVCQLKLAVEKLMQNDLPLDKFPAMGPTLSASGEAKSAAKSVRKFGANSRWAKKDNVQYSGGRYIVFVAGGISYAEMRVGSELMQAHSKEVVVGGSHIISPTSYLVDVGSLHTPPEGESIDKRMEML